MKTVASLLTMGFVTLGLGMALHAQPPQGPGGGPGGPGGPEGFGPRPPHPVLDALDANGDHILDADEIANASKALTALDGDSDGKLSDEEMRPHFGGGPGNRPGPPPGAEGGPPDGPRGQTDRDGAQRGVRNPGGTAGRPGQNRGRPGAEGDGPPNGQHGGPPGGPPNGPPGGPEQGPPNGPPDENPPPPSPERFVEHAMEFDADNNGSLSREELIAFAAQMPNHRPEGPPPPGGNREKTNRPPMDIPPRPSLGSRPNPGGGGL